MTTSDPDRLPDELLPVADLLRRNRPEATALELDGIKRQVRSRASGIQKGTTMKSRLAMTAMLVVGLLMSGTGAGLAVSGITATDNPAAAQYPPTTTPPTVAPPVTPNAATPPTATTAPPAAGGTLPQTATGGQPDDAVKGEEDAAEPTAPTEAAPAAQEPAVQAPAQVAAKAGELPFTGLAAVPILIGGIALMAGGLVLRRRTAA